MVTDKMYFSQPDFSLQLQNYPVEILIQQKQFLDNSHHIRNIPVEEHFLIYRKLEIKPFPILTHILNNNRVFQ